MEWFPRVIHFVFLGPCTAKAEELDWWRTLNPCYEIRIHDDCDSRDELNSPYLKGLGREEKLKLGILLEYGGWCFPEGVWPLIPLSQLEIWDSDIEPELALIRGEYPGGVCCVAASGNVWATGREYLQLKALHHPIHQSPPEKTFILRSDRITTQSPLAS